MIGSTSSSSKESPKDDLDLYKHSVLKISAEGHEYSYSYPWQGPQSSAWGGSGFVVNFEGKPYIITNAHVSADASQLEVRIASDDTKYLAKVVNVDHDCDLAMLQVDDASFWEKVKPLELGGMPGLQDKLKVVGFPMGGNEMCITKGMVSRSEVGSYCHSGVELLHTQVTAEINPGNSGGPAIFENKVLGVAFQGIMFGDGLGYIIPAPVLRHFIADTVKPEPYQGFPNLEFTYQKMENKYIRDEYGLNEGESGIRVKSVDTLSSCHDLIKPDDILLAIDGKKIQNDGNVETSFSNRIKFIHLIRDKSIGDSISVDILRKGERLNVTVPLLDRSSTTKVAQKEWDKAPTYYIHSGIAFAPVTHYASNHARYRSKAKKQPGDEKVMIHTIFASEHTRGLDKRQEKEIIKSINGKKVRNLREVIAALESHDGPRHKIETKQGSVFVFKRISPEENESILKSQRIPRDRSDDLLIEPSYKPGCPEYKRFTPSFNNLLASSSSKTLPSTPILSSQDETTSLKRATMH